MSQPIGEIILLDAVNAFSINWFQLGPLSKIITSYSVNFGINLSLKRYSRLNSSLDFFSSALRSVVSGIIDKVGNDVVLIIFSKGASRNK